jgi:type VI secretion system secreted protein Hcp
MIKQVLVIAPECVLATTSLPLHAAAYMKLGDIKGESTDQSHVGWSDLHSVSLEIVRPSGDTLKKGGSSTTVGDVVVVKEWDSSAPALQHAAAENLQIPNASIEVYDDQGRLRQVYELRGVQVTSHGVNPALAVGSVRFIRETISLDYSEIRSVAFPLNPEEPLVEWYHVRDDNQ